MRADCRIFLFFVAAISLGAVAANSQDAPSLGDLARQQRQQKQLAKAAPSKDAKPPKVITNEDCRRTQYLPPLRPVSANQLLGLTLQALQRCQPNNGSRRSCQKKIRLRRCKLRSIN
jgi:hypothetical protein